jgi:hypothetical protein
VSALQAVSCQACGGAVAMPAGAPHPRCLFCGSEAVVATRSEDIEPPGTFLPFEVDQDKAQELFADKAQASIWYPGNLRDADLELDKLLLPAWAWSGKVETHWAALVISGRHRSGKRPETGVDTSRVKGVLVPSSASSTISRDELDAIAPFSDKNAFVFRAEQAVAPFELGKLTRSAARKAGAEAMAKRHRLLIAAAHRAVSLSGSHLFDDLDGVQLLLPVYVGVYRHRGKPYRVVMNGQSGKLTGDFPYSWLRIGCAAILFGGIATGLVIAMLLLVWIATLYA